MSKHRFLPLLLSATTLLAASACARDGVDEASEDDVVAEGDHDLVGTRPGSAIRSAYVKPNRSYYPARSISFLTNLGALSGDALAAVRRADGILGAERTDDVVTLEELVRLEAPEIAVALLPSERSGLAKAWRLMEAPSNAPPAYLPAASTFSPAIAITRQATPIDASTSLPAGLESPELLRRVQQISDTDRNPATVSMSDCDAALANRAAFLPDEVAAIERMRARVASALVSVGTARLDVPKPRRETKSLGTMAGMKLSHVRVTFFEEVRNRDYFDVRTKASRRSFVLVGNVRDGDVLVAAKSHRVLDGYVDPETGVRVPGAFVWAGGPEDALEVWRRGERRAAIALGALEEDGDVPLADVHDFAVFAGGQPLFENAVGLVAGNVRFVFQTSPAPPAGGVTDADVQRVASPKLDLHRIPVGSYPLARPSSIVERIDVLSDTIAFHVSSSGGATVVERFRPGGQVWVGMQRRAAWVDSRSALLPDDATFGWVENAQLRNPVGVDPERRTSR